MEFTIIKDKDNYHFDIIQDDKTPYTADYEFKGFKKSILLKSNDKEISRIIKKNSLFKKKYILQIDSIDNELKNTSALKMIFETHVKGNKYLIQGHTGKKYSIFKNGNQIAALIGHIRETDAHSGYKLIADYDVDVNVLLTITLAIIDTVFESIKAVTSQRDKGKYRQHNTTISFGGSKFDENWKPKTK